MALPYPLPTLTGPRAIVRPGTDADVPLLAGFLAEPAVHRWWGDGLSGADLRTLFEGDGDGTVMLVVCARAGSDVPPSVAGGIQYWENPDEMFRHAGVDIFLGSEFHGHGIGSEAIRLLSRWLTTERGHHRLTIDPEAENKAAIAAYTKVGFRPVGVLREYFKAPDGQWHDGVLMDLLAADLDQTRQRG